MNINHDLQQLTNIPDYLLNKLTNLTSDIISHYVVASKFENSNTTEIDLGFGKLVIYIVDEEIHYKFIPSTNLEEAICNAIINNEDILITKAEKSLKDKFMKAYKELF